jgi:hypothetical protein
VFGYVKKVNGSSLLKFVVVSRSQTNAEQSLAKETILQINYTAEIPLVERRKNEVYFHEDDRLLGSSAV